MIFTNATVYESRTLRRLIVTVYEYLAIYEGRMIGWRGKVNFKVTYSRSSWCTGSAACPGYSCDLRLTKPSVKPLTYGKAVWLIYHEMMHLYGYHHRQFRDLQDEVIQEILSPIGHTLTDEMPTTLPRKGGKMKVKLSGTTYSGLDLTGVSVESTKESRHGKGTIITLEIAEEAAREIAARLRAIDVKGSTASYELRYAARVDASKIEKLLSPATTALAVEAVPPVAEAPVPPPTEPAPAAV